ncbi:MAG: RidA family protein [Firmicutes bacterium]|nr:RidA family protein [Bacillota bacterium]
MNKMIFADNAPAAVGPYSHGIDTGNVFFCSGQLGLDPVSGELKDGVREQTIQSLANLDAVLGAAGYDKTNVVKTVVFIKNMNDFGTVNEVYAEYFGGHKPARSCVEVARLPKDGLIEIECIAVK